jgi:hypothetical protein
VNTQTHPSPAVDALRGAEAIVVYTNEKGEHDYVRRAALEAAQRDGLRLILYPLESYEPLSNPLPDETWSGEGAREQYGDPLSVADLEMLGQEWLAAQVVEATRAGIDAGATLPRDPGVEPMVDYARSHGARAVLLPREALADAGPIDQLLGQDTDTAARAEETGRLSVLLVDPDGKISHASQEQEPNR